MGGGGLKRCLMIAVIVSDDRSGVTLSWPTEEEEDGGQAGADSDELVELHVYPVMSLGDYN